MIRILIKTSAISLFVLLVALATYYVWFIFSLTTLQRILVYLVSVYLSVVIAALFAEYSYNFFESAIYEIRQTC
jgi:hypothetical protein